MLGISRESDLPLIEGRICFSKESILGTMPEPRRRARGCFSFTAARDRCYRHSFTSAGLCSRRVQFPDGTVVHVWAPKTQFRTKPNLVCIHGLGANSMWQWSSFVKPLLSKFNVYFPDLLFFGRSFTPLSDRSESFQAKCLMKALEELGVKRTSVVGVSYGGFVGYSMACEYPDAVDRLVVVSSGICMEMRDLERGVFRVSDLEEGMKILIPETPAKLRELVKFSFHRPPMQAPDCFLQDFIDIMIMEYVDEQRELVTSLIESRRTPNIPKVMQPCLLVWGEYDQIFPLELGHRLKRHIGDNAELVVLKNTGHAINMEKPKDLLAQLKRFLVGFPNDKQAESGLIPWLLSAYERLGGNDFPGFLESLMCKVPSFPRSLTPYSASAASLQNHGLQTAPREVSA